MRDSNGNIDKRLLDREWRMSHLYKIRNKDSKKVTFVKNKAQEYVESLLWYRTIVLKARQIGMTTYGTIHALDKTLFTKNSHSMIIMQDQDSSKEKFDQTILYSWKNLPKQVQDMWSLSTDRSNMLQLDFGNGDISSIAAGVKARGFTPSHVHVSELAALDMTYPGRSKEIISSLIPAVPRSGTILIESTAESLSGEFANLFWNTWENNNPVDPRQFKAIFVNWRYDIDAIYQVKPMSDDDLPKEFLHIEKKYQLNRQETTYYFFLWESLGRDWHKLKQQYPTTPEEAFEVAGEKFFEEESVDRLKTNLPQSRPRVDGGWIIYEEPKKNHSYAMGCDVAEGIGRDGSAAVIMDFTLDKPKVVAEFYSNTTPYDEFGQQCAMYGNRYNYALIAIERNNHGHAMIEGIKEEYRNLYFEMKEEGYKEKRTKRIGWITSRTRKPRMMGELRSALLTDSIEIPSENIIRDMMMYVKDDVAKTKTDDSTGHYDRLIALAICYQMKNMISYVGNAETIIGGGKPTFADSGNFKHATSRREQKKIMEDVRTDDGDVIANTVIPQTVLKKSFVGTTAPKRSGNQPKRVL